MQVGNDKPAYCVVDWGTSSFRLWVLSREGNTLAERSNLFGMSTLKPTEFEGVLEASLLELGIGTEIPAVICGMAGAAQGWHEAKYVDLPASLEDLPHHTVIVPCKSGRDVRIIPGLAQRNEDAPNVLRGEETLLLGAMVEGELRRTVCMPGTHSKWVSYKGGVVTRFSTAMTGELFALLSQKSTLSHYTDDSLINADDLTVFTNAVRDVMAQPERFLETLFSVRAGPLLQVGGYENGMSSRLSGLLIGLEIAGMKRELPNHIILISSGKLSVLYSHAFDIAGVSHTNLSAGELARVGLFHVAKNLWPNAYQL